MASEKNELFLTAALDQSFLQIDPAETRHSHIYDHTRRPLKGRARQEISGRPEQFNLVVGRV